MRRRRAAAEEAAAAAGEQPIGSHLFVYPWSHGYSSKGEEFCESDFKKSTVAGPEEKNDVKI